MVAEVRVVVVAVVADRVAESVNSMQKARVHSRKGNAKSRRQPRSPIMGAGNGINMPEYKDHEFFEQVDDRQQARMAAFWQMSPEDWAAEERHWNERERKLTAAGREREEGK